MHLNLRASVRSRRVQAALAGVTAAVAVGAAALPATASYPDDPPGCFTNPVYSQDGSYLAFEGHCNGGKPFRIRGSVQLGTGTVVIEGPAAGAKFPADGRVHTFVLPSPKKAGGVKRVNWTKAIR